MNLTRVCRWMILPLIAALALAQSVGQNAAQNVRAAAPQQARLAAVAENTFGVQLVADAAGAQPRHNVFLSPLSLFLALAMTENGSAGKTRAAFRKTLAIPPDLSEDAFQQAASALSESLRSRQDVDLAIANALWSDPSLPLAPAFVKRCRDYYQADATSLDFHKRNAADVINAWVKQNTRDKIQEIVSPDVVASAKAILTNAVYFKGKWREPFSKDRTHDAVFHAAGGVERKVHMMVQESLSGSYRSGDGFEAAELPYGSSGIAMYAILPSLDITPEQVLGRISVDRLIHNPEPNELDLQLPRFSLDYSAKLKLPLSRLGLAVAFSPRDAEFTPMGSPLFYMAEVFHKTRLEVDEEGTVAAAATGVVMRPRAAMQKPPKKVLIFDRPFAVLLCDSTTGAILFAGVIYDPT